MGRQLWICLSIPGDLPFPLLMPTCPPAADLHEVLGNVLGYEEAGFNRPAQLLLGSFEFSLSRRFTMGCGGVLLCGQAVSDVCPGYDQRWAWILLGNPKSLVDSLKVVAILYSQHMPAVSSKPIASVLCESKLCAAVDGDAIIVIEVDEAPQLQMASQGSRLMRHPLHQVAI